MYSVRSFRQFEYFKKTYQFHAVKGVCRLHKTANIDYLTQYVAQPVSWDVYIGLRGAKKKRS